MCQGKILTKQLSVLSSLSNTQGMIEGYDWAGPVATSRFLYSSYSYAIGQVLGALLNDYVLHY